MKMYFSFLFLISYILRPYKSALEAGSAGASQATQAVFGIIANVIAFLASIYFINGVLAWMGGLVGTFFFCFC